MGCNSSKQVQIQPAAAGEGSKGSASSIKDIRGDLYIAWPSAPCRAVLMTCGALGVKPNIKNLDLFKGEQKSSEFTAINPMHSVPTYVDGDFKIWESRAIMPYLVTMFGGPNHSLYPKDPKVRSKIDNVLSADQTTFYKAILEYARPHVFGNKDNVDMNEKREGVMKALKILDEYYLAKHPYVAGPQLTIADFSVFAGVTFTEVFDEDLSHFKNISSWVAKLKKLPYFEMCNKGLYELKEQLKKRNQN